MTDLPTPFDDPKTLVERITYPSLAVAYRSGYYDASVLSDDIAAARKLVDGGTDLGEIIEMGKYAARLGIRDADTLADMARLYYLSNAFGVGLDNMRSIMLDHVRRKPE